MSSTPLKRKLDSTDSAEGSPKRQRVEPNAGAGEDSQDSGQDSVAALQAKLKEVADRYAKLEKEARENAEALQRARDRVQCCICRDAMCNPYTMECGHSACLKCLRRCFISSPAHSEYAVYNGQDDLLTDDDSDGEDANNEGAGQQQARRPHRERRFHSVVSFAKQCPICKKVIRQRPVVDYTLRHIIDDINPTPISPKALMDRDQRWGRRRDVWRGIFPTDPYADNDRPQETPQAGAAQTPTQDRNQTHLVINPASVLRIRRGTDQRRTERWVHPYDAEMRLRRQRRADSVRDTDRSVTAIGRPSSSRPVSAAMALAISPSSSSRSSAEAPVTELGSDSASAWPFTVPRLPFFDTAETSLQVVEAETREPSPPLPELADLPSDSSSSVPSDSPVSPQSTIQEILQILRPQDDLLPPTPNEEAEDKEIEEILTSSDARPEREAEANQEDPEDYDQLQGDDDEDVSLIHAMLHGEGPRTNSSNVERYPVYIEELELPVERGDEGAWLGADLED